MFRKFKKIAKIVHVGWPSSLSVTPDYNCSEKL